MPVTAIVGANWGDEGKGKTTDYLAARADFVVRFQGGNNAGHTIINEYGKFALHLIPSGVFYPDVVNVLGPGVAVNITAFLEELKQLAQRGVPEPVIRISERAQVVLPYHILFDEYEEERLGSQQFGSTKMGIAPFYADKYMKVGVQVADLYHEKRLRARLESALAVKNALVEHLYRKPRLDIDEIIAGLLEDGRRVDRFVCDTTSLLHDALAEGNEILLEGQLGALRDPDHGIYPYPTSSSPLAGFGAIGAGVPPYAINRIIAVTKAYSSCVGAGPFVTELTGPEGDELRLRGGDEGEFGATTGRPRRVGWFDAVATRYGCRVQGATEVVFTVLDALGYLDEIPICVAYEVNRKTVSDFPNPAELGSALPVFEVLPGWREDISDARYFDDLPANAQAYVLRIEELIGVPVKFVSVGSDRQATIVR
ncbi:MAG: adenylosuccinate synthase [Dehalococcoidales bacterium]|nr:MAG: adenylosuccinate synthase [Dehalococcoidales bacterium]